MLASLPSRRTGTLLRVRFWKRRRSRSPCCFSAGHVVIFTQQGQILSKRPNLCKLQNFGESDPGKTLYFGSFGGFAHKLQKNSIHIFFGLCVFFLFQILMPLKSKVRFSFERAFCLIPLIWLAIGFWLSCPATSGRKHTIDWQINHRGHFLASNLPIRDFFSSSGREGRGVVGSPGRVLG